MAKQPYKEHDKTFKKLFSNPKKVLYILKKVIGYKWAEELQEDSIEYADKEFIDEEFSKWEAAIIARAKLKDREVYFLCRIIWKH